MGGKAKDPNKAAMQFQREQMRRLEGLDLPELQEYVLQSPELVGLLEAEGIDPSALEEISLDPAMREKQLQALEGLQERADQGITATDRFQMEQLLGDVGAQEQARQAQIESQMAQRGMDSSGAALMAQLQGKQSSANQARERAMQMAAQGQQNRSQALAQLGQQAGQMEQAQFGREAQVASARDAIARANAMNRQQVAGQNLAARQAIEGQRAGIANQQAQVANQLAQQRFQNEMSRITGQGQTASAMSNIAGNAPQQPSAFQSALGGAATGASIGSAVPGIGTGVGAGVGAAAGLLSSGGLFEDGGIARNYEDGGIAMKARQDEEKQKAAFKKKYMKKIHEEMLGDQPKVEEVGRKELTQRAMDHTSPDSYKREPLKYANGGLPRNIVAATYPQEARGEEIPTAGIEGLAQGLAAVRREFNPPLRMADGGLIEQGIDELDRRVMLHITPESYKRPVPKFNLGGVINADEMNRQQEEFMKNQFAQQFQVPLSEGLAKGKGKILGQDTDKTSADIQTYEDAKALTDKKGGMSIDSDALSKSLGALNEMFGAQEQERDPLKLSYQDVAVKNVMNPIQAQEFGNAWRAEDGGAAVDPILRQIMEKHANKKPKYASDGMGGPINSGEGSYAGDRVDAKVNDGELILNIPQQQRLMDLLRGEIGLTELGDEDIVEGVPKDYRDELHEELEEESESPKRRSIKSLLEALGKES